MRARINFDKTEAMRFTGHLDLYRTWERTFRRASLPLAYSQGFKPHPCIQIAAALPLGFTSSNDLIDIWLEEPLPLSEIQARLQPALPPGLRINSIAQVPLGQPALQSLLRASEYQITLLETVPDLANRIQELSQRPEILLERRGKPYNLRPLLLSIELLPPNSSGLQRIYALLRTEPSLYARPDELMRALGIPPEKALFHRMKLHFGPTP
ncbi:MAG: TIGR03936 family radical SAM-associated protein [Anaerolineales bacterium]|nr:TIGR03936 family radical SAM-associated protein [Anaerolineales bacterium]MDW8445653.1 TIGR03936 family radical SAM-associated protein [Anaerolineales bacterium]